MPHEDQSLKILYL